MGHVSMAEFTHGLTQLTQLPGGDRAFQDQTKLIFSRYDLDGDGMLSYPEFCQMFLPQSDLRLQDTVIQRRPQEYTNGLQFLPETLDLLQRLLRAHLDLEQSHDFMRHSIGRMMQAQNCTAEDLFAAIDGQRKGYLTAKDFEFILTDGGRHRVDPEDAAYLIRLYGSSDEEAINVTNLNKRISFQDFANQIQVRIRGQSNNSS